jgi:UDP-glucose 4-epimerase
MNIAVTGAAGFIGSRIVFELTSRGHRVISLVRPALDDKTSLASRLEGVQTICHCAWMGHPRQEVDIARNISTSVLVAMAADIAKVEHMVFMSSGGGIKGTTEYAIGKYGVEGLFSKELGLFDFDLTILRPSAVYGPGQDPSKGLGAVTTFLNSAMNNKPIHILGSPYSGRDFLHVDDLAECTAEVIEQKILGQFEIGGPETIRLNDLIIMVETVLFKPAIVQIENPTGVDPQTICLDNTLITEATGWTPKRRVTKELHSMVESLKGNR